MLSRSWPLRRACSRSRLRVARAAASSTPARGVVGSGRAGVRAGRLGGCARVSAWCRAAACAAYAACAFCAARSSASASEYSVGLRRPASTTQSPPCTERRTVTRAVRRAAAWAMCAGGGGLAPSCAPYALGSLCLASSSCCCCCSRKRACE